MIKPSGRYTILVADRRSGVVRRATVPVRPVAIAACVVAATPILIGMGAAWKASSSVSDLRASHHALEVENANYRAATEALSGQITSLQEAIADLGDRSALDPNLAQAMNRLPAIVKSRAMGGTPAGSPLKPQEPNYAKTLSALASPDDTFGLLRTLLDGLENRLQRRRAQRRSPQRARRGDAVDVAVLRMAVVRNGPAQGSDYRRQ